MPCKRSRRSSSVSDESVSVTDYNEDSIQSASSSISTRKRRKTIDSRLEVSHCQEILDKLRNAKAEDGHLIADSFVRLPNKRTASDYYDVIEIPIDIIKIQSRIKSDEYETFYDFQADVEQLVENAKTYHSSSSLEYQDSVLLWNAFEQEKRNIAIKADVKAESSVEGRPRRSRKRIAISIDDGMSDQISLTTSEDSRNTSEVSSNYSENPLEAYFTSIVSQKTDDGKDVTSVFTFMPSKTAYPQYHEAVKEPIDLRTIAKRIKSGVYLNVDDIERDFYLMVKNAKLFNEPKSEIFQNAVELQKILKLKRTEMETGIKTQKAKRGRKRKIPLNLTEKYAKLESPKDSDEFDSEEQDDNLECSVEYDEDLNILPSDNRYPQWQLYKTITSITLSNGNNLCAPFMKLPSKKIYPDYYLEILEPMSLLMVKAKIKKSLYEDIDQIVKDMDLVFNNAQQFNVEDSAIYKESVRLQNVTHMKKEELTGATPQDDYMDELLPLIPQSLPAILPEIFKYSSDNSNKKRQINNFSKINTGVVTPTAPRRTRPPMTPEELKQKRINNLFQSIYGYQEDNRYLRDIFMTLPSRDQYPDYYKVIPDPIDLTMIRKKIDEKKYESHLDLVDDLKLMFSNAKHYNEQSSQVFKDAVTLEKIMKKKTKNIAAACSNSSRGSRKKSETSVSIPPVAMSPVFTPPVNSNTPQYRIRELFQTIKEYRDVTGRLLSEPFIRLPSKSDMPEYYEFIKKPIELQTIQYRINNDRYQTVEDLMSEFVLMFDNACKFNEPDSQIYRDALVLLRVALEKKAFLTKDDNLSEPPNVQEVSHDIMITLFTQFYNYVDEDGRYLVDSINEIDGETITRKAFGENACAPVDSRIETCKLNLDTIKHDLTKRRYRRMDRLQEDVFSFLKYVRSVSPLNSQAYEDAYELQKIFITLRDVHCKRGEILLTPALNYIERYLHQDIEIENKERKFQEIVVDDNDNIFIDQMKNDNNYRMLDSVNRQDNSFEIGEFVRIQYPGSSLYNIGEITGIMVPNSDGIHADDSNSDGCLIRIKEYYHPRQTKHKSTRRFIDNEVFQTCVYNSVPLNQVVGKCVVLYIKDYVKYLCKKFRDSNIYICESKYSVVDNRFKKLKNLSYKNSNIKDHFIIREDPLVLKRSFSTVSVDVVKQEPTDFTFILENVKESVLQEDRSGTESCVYYDQYVCENGFSVKVGDYVYVKDITSKLQIVRIDQLWKNLTQNVVYFSGPWFIKAMNVEHMPTKVFYRKEVFLSSLDGATHLLTTIIGKCVILSFSDYCKYRPTEYAEENMYVCEFKYFTEEKVAKKLKKGLKKAQLSTKALDDEIYFFKRELVPNREASPLLYKCSIEPIRQEYITQMIYMSQIPLPVVTPQVPFIEEETKDSSLVIEDTQCNVSVTSSGNNGSERKSGKRKKLRKPPSGYVLYAGEVRKKLLKDNPEAQFGEISKEVGQMWRNMAQTDKDVYERRALEIKHAMEKESALAKQLAGNDKQQQQQQQQHQMQNIPQQMYVNTSPAQNQRNFIQIPQNNQSIISTGSTSHPNQGAPIHYFQASNGQVLQFISSNVQQPGTANGVQFTSTAGPDQQIQMIQQQNPNSQQVIYQIASQNQGNQAIINNTAQFTNSQYMMPQNKMSQFSSPQLTNPQQSGQMPNITGLPMNQVSQNQNYTNFTPNPNLATQSPSYNNLTQNQQPTITEANQAPVNFVSVPSRSARVLHSEIYQKYIEKLRKNSPYISDWKQQLEFSKETALSAQGSNKQAYINKLCQDVAPAFLDSKLLIDKDGKKFTQDAIVDSLFKLRDHLLHDAMNIRTKILGLEEL